MIDISESSIINQAYKKNKIKIGCFFYQNNVSTQILRIDVCTNNKENYGDSFNHIIAKSINKWSYPGQDYPAPIFLAHQKCNIREGCAEVLYEEIITKMHNTSIENQLTINQMR